MGKESTPGGADALASARTGDVVLITCPSREAVVADISAQYVSVRWPWNQIDPESMMQWNGLRAIPLAPDARDWSDEPFQVTTPPSSLHRGGVCEVGIPDTVAYVVHVAQFSEPLDVGWFPRPNAYVSLVAHGVKIFPDMEEIGFTLDPDGEEPIESQLICRPYAFLEDGDEVADSEGRMWKYRAPWNWTPFDNGPGAFPVWPLHLACRNGEENPDASANVAHATRSGGHGREIARWLECAGLAEVPRLPPAVFGEDFPG
ncbi:hypothetical protein [Streptomyces sp. SAS_272]|uniref:hypothetical protein n=1 Tax=Streptomyces sp. SAS_272 TaxID=3412747 RepID=UPI00403CF404